MPSATAFQTFAHHRSGTSSPRRCPFPPESSVAPFERIARTRSEERVVSRDVREYVMFDDTFTFRCSRLTFRSGKRCGQHSGASSLARFIHRDASRHMSHKSDESLRWCMFNSTTVPSMRIARGRISPADGCRRVACNLMSRNG